MKVLMVQLKAQQNFVRISKNYFMVKYSTNIHLHRQILKVATISTPVLYIEMPSFVNIPLIATRVHNI
jgi:hypothetical protein